MKETSIDFNRRHIISELETRYREGEINNLDQAFNFVEDLCDILDVEYSTAEIASIVAYVEWRTP